MGTLKGRLTDADGKPLAGITVRPSYRDQVASNMQFNTPLMTQVAVTDASGSFTLPGVLPGLACDLNFNRHRQRFSLSPKPAKRMVESGEEKDLGDLTVREAEEN
jgi:hypothetical protein